MLETKGGTDSWEADTCLCADACQTIVWIVVKEEEERRKKAVMSAAKVQRQEADARREEMRREAGLSK